MQSSVLHVLCQDSYRPAVSTTAPEIPSIPSLPPSEWIHHFGYNTTILHVGYIDVLLQLNQYNYVRVCMPHCQQTCLDNINYSPFLCPVNNIIYKLRASALDSLYKFMNIIMCHKFEEIIILLSYHVNACSTASVKINLFEFIKQ